MARAPAGSEPRAEHATRREIRQTTGGVSPPALSAHAPSAPRPPVVWRYVLHQFQREVAQQFDAGGCDQVVVFQTNASVERRAVQARFGGEHVADFELVVPERIQMGPLVREQANAMPQV